MTTNMDEGYRLYGATVLAQLAADMAGESAGVKAGTDIEYIHRMRVASRRLRAALPLFAGCFPEKEYKRWENEIKQITRSLGRAVTLTSRSHSCGSTQKNRPAPLFLPEPHGSFRKPFAFRKNKRTQHPPCRPQNRNRSQRKNRDYSLA